MDEFIVEISYRESDELACFKIVKAKHSQAVKDMLEQGELKKLRKKLCNVDLDVSIISLRDKDTSLPGWKIKTGCSLSYCVTKGS